MKEKIRNDLVVILVLACLVAVVTLFVLSMRLADQVPPGEYRLPVFETTDVHGYLGSEDEGAYRYRMAFIADKVNDERRARSSDGSVDVDTTVLLDTGDVYQGSADSLIIEGESLSAVYDYMQYDAVGIGNHEFDWGLDAVIDDADNTMRDYTAEDGSGAEKRVYAGWAKRYQSVLACDLDQPAILKTEDAVTSFFSSLTTVLLLSLIIPSGIGKADYIAFNASFALIINAMSDLLDAQRRIFVMRPLVEQLRPMLETDAEEA